MFITDIEEYIGYKGNQHQVKEFLTHLIYNKMIFTF